jgi:hypothetical protein
MPMFFKVSGGCWLARPPCGGCAYCARAVTQKKLIASKQSVQTEAMCRARLANDTCRAPSRIVSDNEL